MSNRYSLYLESDLNRVFRNSVPEVAAAELRLALLGVFPQANVSDIERVHDGRSQVLRFDTDVDQSEVASLVGQLSASAALFVHRDALLEPIPIDDALVYSDDVVSIQRYKGKTSERLTRTMLNCALASAGINPASPAGRILDPMCGRGTTLNWALAYGLHAVGVDADRPSLEEHARFLETWAKRSRLPHKAQKFRAGNAEHRVCLVDVAPDRETLKAGRSQRVETFCADSANQGVSIGSVDAIVTDLPYGVYHQGANARFDRPDTAELLASVLPAWRRWVRSGGAICMAWNTKRADRRQVSELLARSGFSPVTVSGGFSMRHTVDATIDRDVIVAVAG